MTPRHTFVGTMAAARWLNSWRRRMLLFGTLISLSLVLAVYPERFRAATSLTPADPESLGLSGTLGQLGAFNNVFGNQAAVEVAMRIAKSVDVRNDVIDRLALKKRLGEKDRLVLHRWLEDEVTVRSLRGGIITIEMSQRDPSLAHDIVAAYAKGTQERLADVSRRQTAYKREVLSKLVADSSMQLAKAQADYDNFRLGARYTDPRSSIGAVAQRVPALENAIKAKQIELQTARKIYTDNNLVVKQILAELSGLQGQLAEAKATNPAGAESVGKLVSQTSQLYKLERELGIAKALYDSYMRYLQGTAVEDLTSTANMRVLEPAYVDTARQYRLPVLAVALLLALLWASIEFYRLRPPVGARFGPEQGDG